METPGLTDELIAARLRQDYGVRPTRLCPLSLGADSDARVWRVETADEGAYFLKAKIARAGADDLGAAVARALVAAGIDQVVVPLPTKTGALRLPVGGVALTLYPFVEGRTGWDDGLSTDQWSRYGAILRRLHATTLPPDLTRRLPRETFVPVARWSRVVEGLLAGAYPPTGGEAARELAALVAEKHDAIGALLRRARQLGRRLQGGRLPFVLCHGDRHVNNVLLPADPADPAGGPCLIDWDQPILAPKERDLMFVIGPALNGFPPGSPEEAAFFAGYGVEPTEPDPLALAYYRYGWAVEDIGAFAEAVVARPDIDADGQRDALAGVRSVFAPNGIAEAADRSAPDQPAGPAPSRRNMPDLPS